MKNKKRIIRQIILTGALLFAGKCLSFQSDAEDGFYKIQKLEPNVYYSFDLNGDGQNEEFYYTNKTSKKIRLYMNGKCKNVSEKKKSDYDQAAWYFANINRYGDNTGELIFMATKSKDQFEELSVWNYHGKDLKPALQLDQTSKIRNFQIKNIQDVRVNGNGSLIVNCSTPYELTENRMVKKYRMSLKFLYNNKNGKLKRSKAKIFQASFHGKETWTIKERTEFFIKPKKDRKVSYVAKKGEKMRLVKIYPLKNGAAWVKFENKKKQGGWKLIKERLI